MEPIVTRLSPPVEEPVSIDEARAYLRIDHDDEDGLIQTLIKAGRSVIENATGRALVRQGWMVRLPGFPADRIELPRVPCLSVDEVVYLDPGGESQVMPKGDYTEAGSDPAFLLPRKRWPATNRAPLPVRIMYMAGYGTAADVPDDLKYALLLLIGQGYETRTADLRDLPFSVDALLAPYKDWRMG